MIVRDTCIPSDDVACAFAYLCIFILIDSHILINEPIRYKFLCRAENVRFPDRRWRCDVSDVQQGGAGARPRGLTPVILYKYVLMGVGRLISVLVN